MKAKYRILKLGHKMLNINANIGQNSIEKIFSKILHLKTITQSSSKINSK